MSVDLDWSKLDASFASSLIDLLNRQLQNTPRPSFIGPIEISSFDFGSQPPDIELVDLRDIYHDFLEDDDEDDDGDEHRNGDAVVAVERDAPERSEEDEDEDEEFEWVSRKTAGRGVAEEPPTMYYHHLPPHVRYARGPASDVFALARPPSLRPSASSSLVGGSAAPSPVVPLPPGPGTRTGSLWTAAVGAGAGLSSSLGALPPVGQGQRRAISPLSLSISASASAAPSWRSFPGAGARQTRSSHLGSTRPTAAPSSSSSSSSSPSPPPSPPTFSPQHSDLADIIADPPPPPPLVPSPRGPTTTTARGVASTDATQDDEVVPPAPPNADADDAQPNLQLHLLVSWHSDLRLTLTTSLRINYPSPLFMSLPIKLSVTGLVFTGELAVAYEGGRRVHLCVLDDLDPYGPSARRFAGAGSHSHGNSTPSDLEGEGDAPTAKPLPVGQRLLPEIFIESELGQADKHVLKNVTRVEKFVQDVIRKTIEEELVFPNFHTLVLR